MSRINILNATAEDFKLEVFASAPSNGSTGDHADGRIVKYGTHLYMWHDLSGVWVQFGNASDISSLETRLSQQEAECDSDVSSLESKDSSLETRISSEEVARASAVSSANARAVAAEGSLETRLSAEEVARAADVNAEESRAILAEGSVETRLSIEESARVVAVDSLETRAEAAELSLTNRISAEESAEAAAEGSLNTRMADEESVRLAKDGSLETAIAGAGSSRASADSSLETRLSTEEDRVDAILNASSADKDSFAEIVSFINSVDVAHDSQTSTEISSIDSAIASAESARIADDSSLETRLSVEESTEAAAEGSLNTRMAAEESIEASAEASLDARMSSEESARLAADGSLATSISDAASARASGDSSLTTRVSSEEVARAAGDSSLESVLNAAALSRGNADNSLETRLSSEEVARAAAVSSEASSREAADDSLEVRLSTEESQRAANIAVHNAYISGEESSRLAADNSLETRLSSEESAEAAADASLETRLSNEEDAMAAGDSSVETRFSNEVSVEKSRIDAILDSAAADKDTFAELVSFITAVDTESDDALASYVTSIDSSIAAEASSEASAESSLNTVLAAADSVRKAAIDSLEASHSALISAQGSSIAVVEADEAARHLRIDFTNQTTFTVAQSDLPAGFTAGNGMVQIFQEVSTGTYRHIVAPVSYDASTGAMSFDLGVTQKSGFAVFYSFAGDETAVTEVQAFPQFELTGVDVSNFTTTPSVASEITLEFSGIGSEANSTLYNDLSMLFYASGNFGMNGYGPAYSYAPGRTFSTSWDSGYNNLTISWTNNSSTYDHTSGNNFNLMFGHGSASSNDAFLYMQIYFDSNNDLDTTRGVGKYLNDGESLIVSPDYILASNGVSAYTNYHFGHESSSGRYFTGPQWQFSLEDSVYINTNGLFMNFGIDLGSSSATKKGWTGAARMVISGTQRYLGNYSSSHRLYSEITDGATLYTPTYAQANLTSARTYYEDTNGTLNLAYWGKDASGSISNTTASEPDNNTDVEFYFAAESIWADSTGVIDTDSRYDMKIVISMSDGTASNMSVKIYRSDASLSSPSWTEVERGYLSGHNVS